MKLYHGTNKGFSQIDLSKSKPCKDFGPGFYLSDSLMQAEEMAKARVELLGGTPTVLEYNFDESILNNNQLNIRTFDDYTEDWANFIIANTFAQLRYCHWTYCQRQSRTPAVAFSKQRHQYITVNQEFKIYERHYNPVLFRNRTCH